MVQLNGATETVAAPVPLLTEDQRAALDAALAVKAAENAAKAKAQKPHSGTHKPRHSKNHAAAKKGGAGGKFIWGSVFTTGPDDGDSGVLDRNDPNYDSEEERGVVMKTQQSRLKAEVQAYKLEVQSIVEEYFSSGDIQEVAARLEEAQPPHQSHHYFVKRLVTAALDRKGREREMASVALSSLYEEVIPSSDILKGLLALVESVDDLVLDVPNAVELLALFIARAVVDDIIPPAVQARVPDVPGSLMRDIRHRLELNLSTRHAAEKMLRCWEASGLSHADTKQSIALLLDEYVSSLDVEEAARRLRSLAVPFFHHDLVKQLTHRAMAEPASRAPLVALLARLTSTHEISSLQLQKGLQRVVDNLEDTALDNPAAPQQHAEVMAALRDAGILDPSMAPLLPRSPSAGGLSAMSSTLNGGSGSGGAGPHHVHSVAAFKVAATAALKEFFTSQDKEEVARCLSQLDDPGLLHIFVKICVSLAMDRKDRERELASDLLVALYPRVVTGDQMAAGFTRLLAAVDDLVLDIPDAVHLLALFLGRAVADELLPPVFLEQALGSLRSDGLGVQVVKAAGAILSARHGRERLSHCWHGGALSLEQMRAQMKQALQEYLTTQDVSEFSRCLLGLAVPYYHHELVVEALDMAFEHPDAQAKLLSLLRRLSETGDVTQTQMAKGFARMRSALADEVLDHPHARESFDLIVATASQEGWLVGLPAAA